jgi:hypothetical protein
MAGEIGWPGERLVAGGADRTRISRTLQFMASIGGCGSSGIAAHGRDRLRISDSRARIFDQEIGQAIVYVRVIEAAEANLHGFVTLTEDRAGVGQASESSSHEVLMTAIEKVGSSEAVEAEGRRVIILKDSSANVSRIVVDLYHRKALMGNVVPSTNDTVARGASIWSLIDRSIGSSKVTETRCKRRIAFVDDIVGTSDVVGNRNGRMVVLVVKVIEWNKAATNGGLMPS